NVKDVAEVFQKWLKIEGKKCHCLSETKQNMGNTTTKFRKALINGDENLACQIYENNPQLKESLDPNTSYGEPYQHNTPLHYAARHGMNKILGHDHFILNNGS
ncbi:Ankyrin repeat and IBR domain-containing protein 1, partial [Saguinus oedipus]